MPAFATMSFAMRIAADLGYMAHFLPYHHHIDAGHERWNRVLAEELFDLIAFLRPRVIAYDGTMPFTGLLQALDAFRDTPSLWVRRPMWRPHHSVGMQSSHRFTAVVEPGELADSFDHGPTHAEQHRVLVVPPVLHHDPADRFERATARQALGLPEDAVVVAIQLGSGSNFDIRDVRHRLIEAVLRHPQAIALDLRSPIEIAAQPRSLDDRHRLATLFPAFLSSRAFDFAVTVAGYNNFHENVLGAIPTIFVPNEAPDMDVQLARAMFAELHGYGRVLRRDHDVYRIREIVDYMFDPASRRSIKEKCESLSWSNGAADLSDFVTDLASTVRADYDVTRLF
jgi:hypothetical protein